jgi:AcrR family transcriptional regulator
MRRSETDSKLTSRQAKALEALISETSVQGAADAAGVSRATLYRWLREETFAAALREARARIFESLLTDLHAIGRLAIDALREVLEDKKANPSTRVKASLGALSVIIRAREIIETEERLRELEEQLGRISDEHKN